MERITIQDRGGEVMMNPFLAVMDWIEENGDRGWPWPAFLGVGIAVAICFIMEGR
jgi:hypothetical protein